MKDRLLQQLNWHPSAVLIASASVAPQLSVLIVDGVFIVVFPVVFELKLLHETFKIM